MKRKRAYNIIRICAVCFCFTVLLAALQKPVEAKTFNKAAAKKKVSVTYSRLNEGILVICKNKNKTNLKITMNMKFLDGDGQIISKEEQTNLCLTAKSTATFFFVGPHNEYGNIIDYTSYKPSFSVNKSNKTSRVKSISLSSKLDNIDGKFVGVNIGNKKLTNIHATMVFYSSDGTPWFCNTKSLNCFKPNDIDQFSIYYADRSSCPSKVKVYVDWAY